jgi:hypothetical protein
MKRSVLYRFSSKSTHNQTPHMMQRLVIPAVVFRLDTNRVKIEIMLSVKQVESLYQCLQNVLSYLLLLS